VAALVDQNDALIRSKNHDCEGWIFQRAEKDDGSNEKH